jgi:hypothetical protein
MIEFEAGGKSIDAKGMIAALEAAAIQSFKDQIHERIGAIRNPATGEFPTVVVDGTSVDSLQLFIEGSEATLAVVRQCLSPEVKPSDLSTDWRTKGFSQLCEGEPGAR